MGWRIVWIAATSVVMGACAIPSPAPTQDSSTTSTVVDLSVSDRGTPPPGTPEEAVEHVECMAELGFPGRWTSDGYSQPIPDDQTERYLEVLAECDKAVGWDQVPEWTEEQWREEYESLKESAECLRSEGYDIPDAPSFEVYLENPNYTPYRYVSPSAGVSIAEWRRLNDVCPQP